MPLVRLLLPAVLATVAIATSVGPAAALTTTYPHQSQGNRGTNVRAIQHFLRHHGDPSVPVDGWFGWPTTEALKAFQRAHGLQPTGTTNGQTWIALRVPVGPGATGEAVLALQEELNAKRRAGLDVTGTVDGATVSAIKAFQKHARLRVTGGANPETWRALLAHLELPVWGSVLCDYGVGNGPANWGTSATIGQIRNAASRVVHVGHGRIAIGDIGYEHGGDIAQHQTHEHGMDVDIRPMRKAEDQCRWGVNWRWSSYDRAATRDLIKAIRAAAPGHVKLIYFNDPVLVREGLVTRYLGHDDHLHVRYCERSHPVAMYTC
jgi:peptidoglycan hydrolase-like protein with peptidoglycan-binding domain